MIDTLTQLITALREELKNYGALLALLDQQQEQVFSRNTGELQACVGAIQCQAATLHEARTCRNERRREVSRSLDMPDDSPFGLLIPRLPADYQPLVEALVEENNHLLARVQQRARQNHLLLTRSVELMQQFIGSLLPGTEAFTYQGNGRGRSTTMAPSAIYDAVG